MLDWLFAEDGRRPGKGVEKPRPADRTLPAGDPLAAATVMRFDVRCRYPSMGAASAGSHRLVLTAASISEDGAAAVQL